MRLRSFRSVALALLLCASTFAQAAGPVCGPQSYYKGLVATRGQTLTTNNTSYPYANSQAFHLARTNFVQVQFLLSCFYNNGGENQSSGPIVYQASLQYPPGTFTPFTFDGNTSGACNQGTILTDVLTLPVMVLNGAKIYSRLFMDASASSATGIMYGYPGTGYAAGGDGIEVSATSIASKTLGGSISFTSGFAPIYPLAIIGLTDQPSVALVGDSKDAGIHDAGDASGDIGDMARSIGPYFAYVNLGNPSELAQRVGNSSGATPYEFKDRLAVAPYITHAINELGINDLITNVSLATIEANEQLIWTTLFPNAKWFQITMTPVTSSTNGCASAGSQSAYNSSFSPLGSSSPWGQLNAWLLQPHPGLVGTFDIGNTVQPTANSGIWASPGGVSITPDCIHEDQQAALIEQMSGVINHTAIHF